MRRGLAFILFSTLTVACGDDGGTADTSTGSGTGDSDGTDSGSGTTVGTATGSSSASASGSGGSSTSTTTTSGSGTDSGSSTGSTGSGGSDSGSTSGSSSGSTGGSGSSTGSGSTGGGAIMCTGNPPQFPDFDKSCTGNDQCVVVLHQVDCCGNTEAWGINVDEEKAFEEAEKICQSQYPGCGCPAGPPVAEDGKTALDPNDIQVTCDKGTCKSFVP